MKFEIKSWLTGGVLFAAETESMKLCVELAVKQDADLTGAVLTRADLTGADLTGAVLTRADLTGAVLTRADLTDAVLTPIRDDLWAVLSAAPGEVAGLRQALLDGQVDGSTYEGECSCLVGTLAHARGVNYDAIPGLAPNSFRPAERFFMGINKGDTPDSNSAAKLALEWIDDWLARVRGAFAVAESK
jgi:hypothetical protein